jgi:hypothetical protein
MKMNLTLSRLAGLSAAGLAACALPVLASNNAPAIQMAKPKIKSLSVAQPSYGLKDNISFTVSFEGKQCVFNLEFKDATGNVKSQGFFFNNPGQLDWAFSSPASYWGIGAGSFTVTAVPHPNPQVAGSAAVGCAPGTASGSFTVKVPGIDPNALKVQPEVNKITPKTAPAKF